MPIYLGPWQELYQDATRIGWQPPAGSRSAIDLRPLAAQAVTSGSGDGLFWLPAGVDPGAEYRRIPRTLTPAQLQAFEQRLNLPPGSRPLDRGALLKGLITHDADPDGDTRHKPILPSGRSLRARLGPARLRWRFRLAEQPRVLEHLRKVYAKIRQESPTKARKWLGVQVRRLGLKRQDWQALQPAQYRGEEPIEPSTTITETWPTANQTNSIDGDEDWTESTGWNTNASGNAFITQNNPGSPYLERFAVCNRAFSGEDIAAAAQLPTNNYSGSFSWQIGLSIRNAAGASRNTAYIYFTSDHQSGNLHKVIAGTFTLLDQDFTPGAPAYPATITLAGDGSDLTATWSTKTAWNCSATDAAITGNTRFGLYYYSNHATANDGEWSQISANDGIEIASQSGVNVGVDSGL